MDYVEFAVRVRTRGLSSVHYGTLEDMQAIRDAWKRSREFVKIEGPTERSIEEMALGCWRRSPTSIEAVPDWDGWDSAIRERRKSC